MGDLKMMYKNYLNVMLIYDLSVSKFDNSVKIYFRWMI